MRKWILAGLAVLLLAPATSYGQRSHFCPQADDQYDFGGAQCRLGARWRDLSLSRNLSVGNDATVRGDLAVTGAFTAGSVAGWTLASGQLLLPDGTTALPSSAFASAPTYGWYRKSAAYWGFTLNGGGAKPIAINTSGSGGFALSSLAWLGWQSGSDAAGSGLDTFIYRDAANTLQMGQDAATASAQTFTAADSSGAGNAGASLTLSGGSGGAGGAQGEVIIGAGSTLRADNFAIPLVADATVQFGQTVMPDASADGRFDVTTGSATLTIGILGGVGPSTAASTYPVITSGLGYVAQSEDSAVTRGHYLLQSATAGYCDSSATVSTDGLNIAKALYSEPVTNIIDNAGCTGSAGCINTALNTPNTGPAGQITLSADVAAAGWVAGEPVVFWNSGGTTPTGLTDGKVYFLVSVTTVNVTIAATKGGAVVVPSAQGDDPTQYLARLPLSVISIQ